MIFEVNGEKIYVRPLNDRNIDGGWGEKKRSPLTRLELEAPMTQWEKRTKEEPDNDGSGGDRN